MFVLSSDKIDAIGCSCDGILPIPCKIIKSGIKDADFVFV